MAAAIVPTLNVMPDESRSTIYIIGAGFTGTTIAAEIRAKKVFGRVVAFLDDDDEWWYSSYCGCIRHPFVSAIIQQCWWFEIKKALHLEITAVPSYNPPINAE